MDVFERLEDDTAGGVVLFIAEERAELPTTLEFDDCAGTPVASYEAFGRAPV